MSALLAETILLDSMHRTANVDVHDVIDNVKWGDVKEPTSKGGLFELREVNDLPLSHWDQNMVLLGILYFLSCVEKPACRDCLSKCWAQSRKKLGCSSRL